MQLADVRTWIVFAQDDFGGDFGNGGGGPEDAIAMVVILILSLVAAVVGICVWAFVLYTYYTALNAIPPQFRTMEPSQVFLLLIPCFNVIWLFFVVQKIPESFRNYFHAVGDHSRGDCGANIGLWYAILTVVNMIPYVVCLTGIPTLVLMIMFIVKVHELKGVVLAGAANFPTTGGYGGQTGYYAGDPKNPYAGPGDYGPKY